MVDDSFNVFFCIVVVVVVIISTRSCKVYNKAVSMVNLVNKNCITVIKANGYKRLFGSFFFFFATFENHLTLAFVFFA